MLEHKKLTVESMSNYKYFCLDFYYLISFSAIHYAGGTPDNHDYYVTNDENQLPLFVGVS